MLLKEKTVVKRRKETAHKLLSQNIIFLLFFAGLKNALQRNSFSPEYIAISLFGKIWKKFDFLKENKNEKTK